MVAGLEDGDTWADPADDACPFVAADDGERVREG